MTEMESLISPEAEYWYFSVYILSAKCALNTVLLQVAVGVCLHVCICGRACACGGRIFKV